jgi:hypothetical protein
MPKWIFNLHQIYSKETFVELYKKSDYLHELLKNYFFRADNNNLAKELLKDLL